MKCFVFQVVVGVLTVLSLNSCAFNTTDKKAETNTAIADHVTLADDPDSIANEEVGGKMDTPEADQRDGEVAGDMSENRPTDEYPTADQPAEDEPNTTPPENQWPAPKADACYDGTENPAACPISATLSNDTPISRILIGGKKGQAVGVFEIRAESESIVITEIRITNSYPVSDRGIEQVLLVYPTGDNSQEERTAKLIEGVADFSDVNICLPKGKSVKLTVKVDTMNISEAGISGTESLFTLDFGHFKANGLESGEDISAACVENVRANRMVLHKTKPTITLTQNSPLGASVPGINTVLRFQISADSAGDVNVGRLTFRVLATDNAGSGWNTKDGGLGTPAAWSLYDVEDFSNPIESGDAAWLLGADPMSYEIRYARVLIGRPVFVSAGATKTFELRVDTIGASSPYDDMFRVDIIEETAFLDGNETVWHESGPGSVADIPGELLENLPVIGGTQVY